MLKQRPERSCKNSRKSRRECDGKSCRGCDGNLTLTGEETIIF
ncbi:hypothetical protein [uncultured Clostridium sp.]|nr:hypothetical protein [uncultured Clostridium sp.]